MKKKIKEFSYNYFLHIINKYNLSISKEKPIVIFLDGKKVTSSKMFNLYDESIGSFNDSFEKTVEYFSKKYKCIALFGVDEVSFIIENPKVLEKDCDLRSFKAHYITSVFSQKFFDIFKNSFKNNKSNNENSIYWHCKVLNIPKGKIKSYIKYRSTGIFELFMTYFLKKKDVKNAGRIVLHEKIKMCNSFEDYNSIKKFERGHLYINGKLVDLNSYINDDKILELSIIKRIDFYDYLTNNIELF